MKSLSKILALTALTCLAAASFAMEGWMTNYAKATALSKKTGKPILANFTGSDWCVWCHHLESEVFGTKEFKSWASKNVVLLMLDYPQSKQLPAAEKRQNDRLAEKYKIQGYPTVLFLDAKGAQLGQMGYEKGGPKPWIEHASKFTSKK